MRIAFITLLFSIVPIASQALASDQIILDLNRCSITKGATTLLISEINLGRRFNLNQEGSFKTIQGKHGKIRFLPKLAEALNTIKPRVSTIFGTPSEMQEGGLRGSVRYKWDDAALSGFGSIDDFEPALSVYYGEPHNIRTIPLMTPSDRLSDAQKIFKGKILDEMIYKYGDIRISKAGYLDIKCGETKARLGFHSASKDVPEQLGSVAFFLGYTPLDKSQSKPANSNTLRFSVGDKVYVLFEGGKKCPATILLPGKEQSKIEYNKWCETGLISSKQKGEKEWAPNHALDKR